MPKKSTSKKKVTKKRAARKPTKTRFDSPGFYIKAVADGMGLSIRELAIKAKIGQPTLSAVVRDAGRVTPLLAQRLAAAVPISRTVLLVMQAEADILVN